MDSAEGRRSGDANSPGVVLIDGEAPGSGGLLGLLLAGFVVLVVGGVALSQGYDVQNVTTRTPPPIEALPSTPTTIERSPSPVGEVAGRVESRNLDWVFEVNDVEVSADGLVYVVAPVGVAWLDGAGEWTLVNVEGLPAGTGLEGFPGRNIEQIAIGSDGVLWVAGSAVSPADDEQFGGSLDGWFDVRWLWWVARLDGCWGRCWWTVFTSDDVPELEGGIGDLVVSEDGTVYLSVGEDLLLLFDGYEGDSYFVPLPTDLNGRESPWSGSLAVGNDSVVWAATDYDSGGVLSFDAVGFTRYTTEDGLPSDTVVQVTTGTDGTIWVATEAAGVAAFDGTTWNAYTMADGLLSNDTVIATGSDGTVWAVHHEMPPYGYSRFDGTGWTTYPFDSPVGDRQAAVTPDGTLWTVSEDGLASFDGTTRTIHPTPFTQPVPATITLSIDGWEGVEGYRLLTVVSSSDGYNELVGGAFWTMIDSDPYSRTDFVHPPNWRDEPPWVLSESWGEGAYLWDETARLEPGMYRIHFLANPGTLAPHNKHIPAEPIERYCSLDIEVTSGRDTTVNISGIPTTGLASDCLGVTVYSEAAPQPGTVTVSLNGLEGFGRLAVDAWVVPIDLTDEWQRLGETRFGPIDEDPFSASKVVAPPAEGPSSDFTGEAAIFEPGTYRFIIEAYVPSGNMHYGCEMPIQVVEGEPLVVTFTSLPVYTEDGLLWTPLDELRYPVCPNSPH